MRLDQLKPGDEYLFLPGRKFKADTPPDPSRAYKVRFERPDTRDTGKQGALVTFLDRPWIDEQLGYYGSVVKRVRAQVNEAIVVNQVQIVMLYDAYLPLWSYYERKVEQARQTVAARQQRAQQRREHRQGVLSHYEQRVAALGLRVGIVERIRLSDSVDRFGVAIHGDDAVAAFMDYLETHPALVAILSREPTPNPETIR